MNLFTKQKQSHGDRKQMHGYHAMVGKDKLGDWN